MNISTSIQLIKLHNFCFSSNHASILYNCSDLSGNDDMICGCHIPPPVVNVTKRIFIGVVLGKCHTDLGNNQPKVISNLEYSQCNS